MRTPRPWLLLVTALTALAGEAATVQTRDGLRLAVDLPAKIYRLDLDGRTVSETAGGFTLTDPRTGQPTPAGAFTVTAHATAAADRIVVSGTVTAAGDQEAICQLQARLPVGREGWLFWDNLTKSRPVAAGGTYEQPVYPLGCVTSPDRRLGLAVALDPDPLQPGVVSYDPQGKALVVTWSLGFTPLGRP